jgi:nucleoside-diphosphate-sugar epimerase
MSTIKTVVTGGAGFIGSHLVRRLQDEGRSVTIADNLSRSGTLNLADLSLPADFRRRDLRVYAEALEAIDGADVVFHLAAIVGSVKCLHRDETAELRVFQDNMTIDVNVLRACLEEHVKKIIYTSSVSVYPIDTQQTSGVILSEEDLRYNNPEGGYGWAKLLGEIQLGFMTNAEVGIARIFNVYGEGEPLDESAHVIPALVRKAVLYPREDFVVWGDGEQSRCLLYVSDCVEALMKLEQETSRGKPLTVNIGSDKPVPVKEMAERIADISGKNMKPTYDTAQPVGPLSRTADIGKARALLGWNPTVDLDEGLQRTYLWAQKKLLRP